MSPRVIQIPLSSRDGRNYARELKKDEQIQTSQTLRTGDCGFDLLLILNGCHEIQ